MPRKQQVPPQRDHCRLTVVCGIRTHAPGIRRRGDARRRSSARRHPHCASAGGGRGRSASGTALLRRRPGAARAAAPAGSEAPEAAGRGFPVAPHQGRGPRGAGGSGAAGPQRRRPRTGLGPAPGRGAAAVRSAGGSAGTARPGGHRGVGAATAAGVHPGGTPGHTPPPSPAGPGPGLGLGSGPAQATRPFQAQDLGLRRPPGRAPHEAASLAPEPQKGPQSPPPPPHAHIALPAGPGLLGRTRAARVAPRAAVRPAEGAGLGKQTGGAGPGGGRPGAWMGRPGPGGGRAGRGGSARRGRAGNRARRGARSPHGDPRPAPLSCAAPGPLRRAGRPARRAPPGPGPPPPPPARLSLGVSGQVRGPPRRLEGQPSLTLPPKPKERGWGATPRRGPRS